MYRKSKAVFIPLAIIAIFAIFYINYPLFSNSNDMVIQQAENMANIQNKELDKVTIGLTASEGVSSFNIYLNDELLTNTTDSKYTIDNLASGNLYNVKVEFLNEQGEVVETQNITNVSTAKVINSFNESITLPKDTYYFKANKIPDGVKVSVEAGSTIKLYVSSGLNIYGELNVEGTEEERSIITSQFDDGSDITNTGNYWKRIDILENGKLNIKYTDIKYGDFYGTSIYNTKGDIDFENVKMIKCSKIDSREGNTRIVNSKSLPEIFISSNANIILENNEVNNTISAYSNSKSEKNYMKISNNILKTGVINIWPCKNAEVEVKNNTTNYSHYAPIKVDMTNVSSNVIDNISGNENINSNMAAEIEITNLNANVGVYNLPKREYLMPTEIPEGVIVNVSAGSVLKIPNSNGLNIYGELNVDGTEEERSIITSSKDDGSDITNSAYYWKRIDILENGKLNVKYTDIKYGDFYGTSIYNTKGDINFENVKMVKCTEIDSREGNTRIVNSKSLPELLISSNTSVILENNEANRGIQVSASNNNEENCIKINNNIVLNEIINVTPNKNTELEIKNNKVDYYETYAAIKINMSNVSSNVIDNISGNENINSNVAGEIEISNLNTSVGVYNLPKRDYNMPTEIPESVVVNIAGGSVLRLQCVKFFSVRGELNINGTEEERSIITSTMDDGGDITNKAYYWSSISVGEKGKFNVSYAYIKNGGYYYGNEDIISNRGEIRLNNIETKKCLGGIDSIKGKTQVINSKISKIQVSNNTEVIIENNNVSGIQVNANSNNEENSIKINNNVSSLIECTPNINTITEIKNNEVDYNNYVMILHLNNCPYDFFKNVENNVNTKNSVYNYIFMSDELNNIKLYKGNKYLFSRVTIPEGKTLEVEKGTTCKIAVNTSLVVKGNLIANGTNEEKITFENAEIINNVRNNNRINIESTGTAILNNVDIIFANSTRNYALIYNYGDLYLLNSEIKTSNKYYSALQISTNSKDSVIKYNYIRGEVSNSSGKKLDLTYNYWGTTDGPTRVENGVTVGSGPSVPTTSYSVPYNTEFVKTDLDYREFLPERKEIAREHFGQAGINGYTGNYSKTYSDFEVVIPNLDLSLDRTYNSKDTEIGDFGKGWSFGLKSKIVDHVYNSNIKYVYLPNGSANIFEKQSDGSYIGTNTRNKLSYSDEIYTLETKAGSKYKYDINGNLNLVIDKYGNVTTINVGASGHINSIVDYASREYTINYTNDKISKITDPLGRTTTYIYDANGMLIQVCGVNGKNVNYEYNEQGLLSKITEINDNNEEVIVEELTYYTNDNDDLGKIKTVKDANGKIDTYVYNQNDRTTTITDQNNRVKKQYFDTRGYITKQEEPDGKVTTVSYNLENGINKYGEVLSKTDYTGKLTEYTYDSNGNALTEKINGKTKTYTYNDKNNVTKKTDENGNYIEYTYADDGITLLKEKYMDGSEIKYEYYTTGIKGLVKSKTNQKGKVISYEYDQYGNISKETDALGNNTNYVYNNIGWILSKTSPKGTVTTYEYDNSGNNTKVTENGIQTLNEYNYKNNITKTTNGNSNFKIYEYDNAQNLVKVIDEEGYVTTYEYDIYGNKIKENKANNASYIYEYDVLNNITKKTLEQNNISNVLEEISYSYSEGNTTTTTKKYQDDTNYTTYVEIKDFRGNVTQNKKQDAAYTYEFDNAGRLVSETNEIGKNITYIYDNLNRVTKKYEEIEADKYKLTMYEYDTVGNVIKEKVGKEKVNLNGEATNYIITEYSYDDNNNLILKTNSSSQEFKYTYDSENNKIKEEVKISDGKYKTTEYTYNYAGKVTSQKEYIEKSSLYGNSLTNTELTTLQTTYEYDNLNNKIKETLPDTTVINYTYNKINKETKKEVKKSDITISEEKTYDSQGNITSLKDANGNTTTYVYNAQNNMIKEQKPNQVITTYEYDLAGNVTRETLPNNKSNTEYVYNLYNQPITKKVNYLVGETINTITTSYEYDNLDNLLKETTGDKVLEYTYNKSGKCTSKKDANLNTTTYEYDVNLNVVKETARNNSVITKIYDERNNLLKVNIDDVTQEEYTYDLLNNKITEKDELQNEIINTYDINGNLVKTEEVDTEYVVNIQYNSLKDIARKIDNCNLELLYEYDILGNTTKETRKKQDENDSIILSYEYDNLSNKTKEVDGNGNITTYEYDANGNKVKETNALNQSTIYEYDKNGNNTKVTDYLGNETTYIYDSLDRLIESKDAYSNVIEKLEYDIYGRQTKSIDANNNEIIYTYDNNDNILTKTDEEGHTESYEYDSNDNKVKYTDRKGNITTYQYDNKGNLLKVVNALNKATTYTYDNAGNILTQTDPKGNVITYEYDKRSNEIKKIDQLGNEETKTYSKNGNLVSYTTNNGDVFTYEYDVYGRLTKESVNDKQTIYAYDDNDNILQSGTNTKTFDSLNRILTDNQNGHVVSYEYLDSQNKIKITDEKGNVKQEEYDNVGRLKKVIAGEEITEYVYNANGSLQKKIAQNNITEYEYYPDKEIKNLTIKDSSDNIIESHNYEYDNNNNKTKDDNDIYEYDVLDRIKKVNGVEKYTYDNANNITSKTQEDGTVIAYTYNAKNQLTRTVSQKNLEILAETTYTYDANGNQITSTTGEEVLKNIYNEKNELEKVKKNGNEIASYRYDETGKRTEKNTSETTKYVYDGTRVILELGNENEEKAVNTYGLELVSRKQNENNYYYLYNGHGDVTGLVDANNTKVNTYKYDEYGNVTEETEGVENPYRYAGYYYDKETENYYLQSRYYNPAIQRFISEDTVRGDIEDPLSLNLYTYTHNNPLKYIDPNGHAVETLADIGSTLFSIGNMVANPTWGNLGFLLWDMASVFIPAVPGSYAARAIDVVNDIGIAILSIKTLNDLYENSSATRDFSNLTDDIKNKIESIPLNQDDIKNKIESIPIQENNINDNIQSFPQEEQDSKTEIIPLTEINIRNNIIIDNFDDYKPINIMEFNPYGKLGSPAHRQKIDEIEKNIGDRGLNFDREYSVDVTKVKGRTKNTRYIDIVALDENDKVIEMYQVGKVNKNGNPVLRERKAIFDINNAVRFNNEIRNGIKVKFVKYN